MTKWETRNLTRLVLYLQRHGSREDLARMLFRGLKVPKPRKEK